MRLALDRSSALPLWEQVAGFFRDRIRSGVFAPGERLPSARLLAEELGVSRVTTEGAYSQLESEGLVERRQGSGTFAVGRPRAGTGLEGFSAPAWQEELIRLWPAEGPKPGAGLGEEAVAGRIDLSSGLADPALFPAAEFGRAMRRALARSGREGFGYGDPRGFAPFRESVARVLSSRGIDARPEEILVTSGSQEALSLAALLLARRGGRVFLESPSYAAGIGLFRSLGLGLRAIPADEGGMRIEPLAAALSEEKPALIYTMPNFQNPSGASLGPERRSALVALAEAHGVPILEDDYVGDLRYEGRDLPALVSLGAPGAVLYAGTFSKMLAPGLRVGFLLARGPVYGELLGLKYRLSLSSPNIAQRALHEVLSVGSYANHLRRSRRLYRARRDALLAAVAESLPGFSVSRPAGGLFAWLRLPPGLGASPLAAAARPEGLLVQPGVAFYPDGADPEAEARIRLNFAARPEAELVEGVRRLGRAAARLARN